MAPYLVFAAFMVTILALVLAALWLVFAARTDADGDIEAAEDRAVREMYGPDRRRAP